MTEDRIRPESDGEVDSLVTQTYREVASELTPEHLNRAVMKQAADAARPRYLRSVSWTRPMAWAATITLCVALVLEVTNAPVPETSDVVLPSGRLDAPAPAASAAPAPKLNRPDPVKAEALPEAMQDAEVPAERKRTAKISKDLRQQVAAKPASAEEFSMKDDDMLGRAREIATLQTGDIRESDQVLGATTIAAGSAEPSCSETDVAKPDSWLLCIQKLEDAGRMAEADEQRALYNAAYPEDEPL
ncbi:MAG: hypothetical protein OEM99_01915 [Gammaproteobacteria bacterium]|nr:hypothetical protein [Gammaproteobacteria bacterium]